MEWERKEYSNKSLTAFRQSDEGRQLLIQMADTEGVGLSRFVRRLIHDEAKRRGMKIPTIVMRESV